MRVLPKANDPKRYTYADSFGVTQEFVCKLRMMRLCSSNLTHSHIGKSWLVEARPARKWFFNVWIALLAAF